MRCTIGCAKSIRSTTNYFHEHRPPTMRISNPKPTKGGHVLRILDLPHLLKHILRIPKINCHIRNRLKERSREMLSSSRLSP
ncbi:hypothetical protein K443DRAFT_318261 [Laccaria amethystina LaAM-08-1]|uniref:Uncharacterized protein n=1 Tax=Laccaria amethystina LaAM-08-1 TaxID=1095629 RepID=A0A0C9YCN3_9AGAR|nr:hypothetical protein K443DRAFT_318261 [Laccaria amethystina LaAM-08-1]